MDASAVGALFPPARLFFELGPESYSPPLLRKIVYLGANSASFQQAAQALEVVGEQTLSPRFIQTLTERVGTELQDQRDELAHGWDQRRLPEPPIKNAPQAVAIAVDDGKVRVRATDQGPGTHDPQWRNDRVGCLMTVQPRTDQTDPMPTPPPALSEPQAVKKLVAQLARVRSDPCPPAAHPHAQPPKPQEQDPDHEPVSAAILNRTCVATHTHRDRFGPMLAAHAHMRRFFQAAHAVFLGDGSEVNWTIQDLYFPGWICLLDIIHLIHHLFDGANAAQPQSPWPLYRKLLNAAWDGEPDRVLDLLRPHAQRIGSPPKKVGDSDPRKTLANVILYIQANRNRMDYPRARRLGLPITTSHVESLINTFNIRVKGPGKSWCPGNVEAVLQVRAACLSTTDQWDTFWSTRADRLRGRIRPPRRNAA